MVMECIFDKLKCTTPYGTAEQPADKMDDPYELGLRVEHLLSVTNTQRSLHIARLSSRNDVRKATRVAEEEYQTRVAYTTDKAKRHKQNES